MRKLNVILFLVGLVFLVCLVGKLGAGELWHGLGLLGWGLFPFILGEGVSEMIHTVGWRYCLVEPYRSLSWWRLFQIRLAGYAINYLTPTAALGGEATKINLLAAHHPGPQAFSGVLLEKCCFAFAQVLFVVMGSVFLVGRVHLTGPLWFSMLFSVVVVTTGIMIFFLLQKHGKLGGLLRWLAVNRPDNAALQKMAAQFTRVDEALRAFYREQPWNLSLAVGWHLVGFSVGIFQTWLFFHLLKLDASLLVAAAVWFLGMWFDLLTFAVPLNVGTLEGSRILVFKAVGYGSLPGMTYGVAIRFAQMFWSGLGLALYGWLTARGIKTVMADPGKLKLAELPAAPEIASSAVFSGSKNEPARKVPSDTWSKS